MNRRKLCYCGSTLLLDGTCRFKCPPEADPAYLRAQTRARKARDKAARRAARVLITDDERRATGAAVARLSPLYAHIRAKCIRGASKSHGPGARR